MGRKIRRRAAFIGPLLVLFVGFQMLVGSLVPVLMAEGASSDSLVIALSKLCRTVDKDGSLSEGHEADCLSCTSCCYGDFLASSGVHPFAVSYCAQVGACESGDIFRLCNAPFQSRAPPA